jgi:hypothetical protein
MCCMKGFQVPYSDLFLSTCTTSSAGTALATCQFMALLNAGCLARNKETTRERQSISI